MKLGTGRPQVRELELWSILLVGPNTMYWLSGTGKVLLNCFLPYLWKRRKDPLCVIATCRTFTSGILVIPSIQLSPKISLSCQFQFYTQPPGCNDGRNETFVFSVGAAALMFSVAPQTIATPHEQAENLNISWKVFVSIWESVLWHKTENKQNEPMSEKYDICCCTSTFLTTPL